MTMRLRTTCFGPGPGWFWLTRDGMAATALGFLAARPALGRLAYIRAVLAARPRGSGEALGPHTIFIWPASGFHTPLADFRVAARRHLGVES
jgi:hypothetical protein